MAEEAATEAEDAATEAEDSATEAEDSAAAGAVMEEEATDWAATEAATGVATEAAEGSSSGYPARCRRSGTTCRRCPR
jgi:hypothetical protein